jgi:hypothetical protein
MSPQARFFYRTAGYSWTPATETEKQGRLRCAESLAKAEKWLAAQPGHCIDWEFERDPDYSGIDHRDPLYCCLVSVVCTECGGRGKCASLGNIDLGPEGTDDESYKRVVEAELALELMSE